MHTYMPTHSEFLLRAPYILSPEEPRSRLVSILGLLVYRLPQKRSYLMLLNLCATLTFLDF